VSRNTTENFIDKINFCYWYPLYYKIIKLSGIEGSFNLFAGNLKTEYKLVPLAEESIEVE